MEENYENYSQEPAQKMGIIYYMTDLDLFLHCINLGASIKVK
jgi:hypothetical protein